jgi:hypothetical protein
MKKAPAGTDFYIRIPDRRYVQCLYVTTAEIPELEKSNSGTFICLYKVL